MFLINQSFQIQKMAGKGGWSYVVLPNIPAVYKQRFGWIQVKGSIDTVEINQYKLMPLANGNMFLPIKSEIRKKIKKEEGDWVHITLQLDSSHLVVPNEFLMCLMDAPKAYQVFQSFSENSQKHYVDWIYAAKSVETRANRIAKTIEKLELGLKLYQPIE
jgi:hypothetical protein